MSARRKLPFVWLAHYPKSDLAGDLLAGAIVAVMLVPQAMAYAQLAGLPPQVGLYASIAPLLAYSLLGSSRTLAVGPVAMVSLLVASGLEPLATPGGEHFVALALVLAALVGVLQIGMGLARVGFLVHYLSHPVLLGFTSAAAVIIGASQLKHLLGIHLPAAHRPYEVLVHGLRGLAASHAPTLGVGLASLAVLLFFRNGLGSILRRTRVPPSWIDPLCKSGPLVAVAGSIFVARGFDLGSAGVQVVGEIPAGLPPLAPPRLDAASVRALFATAATIAFVSFAESISVAKALASKRRQRVDANQELVALGAANIAAAFTGGYPVTGGFSRSIVNFNSGANSGLASIVTAALVACTVLVLTPLFRDLPQAVLAAIILVAVSTLVEPGAVVRIARYSRADLTSFLATFLAAMAFDIEVGIGVGIVTALGLHLWRTSRPHVAVVGRVGTTEHFRNVLRHPVRTWPRVLAIRVDESLYFPNTKYLEDSLLRAVAERPEIEHLVLICSAVNFIDTSALETLESLRLELRDAGVQLYLAEVKGPVMDRLQRIGFVDELGADRIFLSTHAALAALGCD